MRIVIGVLLVGALLAAVWTLTGRTRHATPEVVHVDVPAESKPEPPAKLDANESSVELLDEDTLDIEDAREPIVGIEMSAAERAEWNRRRRVRLLAPKIPKLRERFESAEGSDRLLAAHELLRYSIAVILEDGAAGKLSEQIRVCEKYPRGKPTVLMPSPDGSMIAYVHQREYTVSPGDFPEFQACNVRAWRLQHGDRDVSVEISEDLASNIRTRADQALAAAQTDCPTVAPR